MKGDRPRWAAGGGTSIRVYGKKGSWLSPSLAPLPHTPCSHQCSLAFAFTYTQLYVLILRNASTRAKSRVFLLSLCPLQSRTRGAVLY